MIIIGNNIFSENLQNLLKDKNVHNFKSIKDFPRVLIMKKILFIGSSFSLFCGPKKFILLLASLINIRSKIYVYFIGSDLLRFLSSSTSKFFANLIKHRIKIYVETEEMQKKLKTANIFDEIIVQPFQYINKLEKPKNYEREGIAFYCGNNNQNFYRLPSILKIADHLPAINFYLLGTIPKGLDCPSNVVQNYWIEDIDNFFLTKKIFIRIPLNDGLGHTGLQALSSGCYVIRSTNFPNCDLYENDESLLTQIISMLDRKDYNAEGKRFVDLNYDKAIIKTQLINAFKL